jgi:hypothetical protein
VKSHLLLIALILFSLLRPERAYAASTLYTVRPSTPVGWRLLEENGSRAQPSQQSQASYVHGPATPPIGQGGIQLTVTNAISSQSARIQLQSVPLGDLTKLTYASFVNSSARIAQLQIVIDLDTTDAVTTEQGRLIYDPALQTTAIIPSLWQEWDALSGKWWATSGAGTLSSACPATTPCTFNAILAMYPNIGLHPDNGGYALTAPASASAYTTWVDDLIVGVNGDTAIYNFEPEIPCTVVCWVDAINGDDMFGGSSPEAPKKTIQAGIDSVSALGKVRVRPGAYSEIARGRLRYNGSGPHTFGLFVPIIKHGITIEGVDEGNNVVRSANSAAATVATNATNSFGPSGLLIEADNVTVSGLRFVGNTPAASRVIEVIGNNASVRFNAIDVLEGRVLVHDPRYSAVSNTAHVEKFHLDNNAFPRSGSIEIANGAGASGDRADRTILSNGFVQTGTNASVSVFGPGSGVPTHVHPVGGVVIFGNNFVNTGPDSGMHLQVAGTYTITDFYFPSYWEGNTFNRAVLVGPTPPATQRASARSEAGFALNNVRGIGVSIQHALGTAEPGDVLLIGPGSYSETLVITQPIVLRGAGAGACARGRAALPSILRGSNGGVPLITIQSDDVTIDGFTLNAIGATAPWMIAARPMAQGGRFSKLRILNNEFVANPSSTPGGTLLQNQDDLLVECNYFNALGSDAVVVEPATDADAGAFHVVYRNNDSVSTRGAHFLLRGDGNGDVWVRDNRAFEDSTVINNSNGVNVLNNRYAGGPNRRSGLLLNGGNRSIDIDGNVFVNPRGAAVQSVDNGISFRQNDTITVTRNRVSAIANDTPDGVALFDLSGLSGQGLVHDNVVTITGNTVGDIHGVAISATLGSIEVHSNTISAGGADISNETPSAGVLLRASTGAGAHMTITRNTLSGFTAAVLHEALPVGVGVVISRNQLISSTWGVMNTGTRAVDARCNWYGSSNGPAGMISGTVTASPWLLSTDLSMPCNAPKLTVLHSTSGERIPAGMQLTWAEVSAPLSGASGRTVVPNAAAGLNTLRIQLPSGFVATSSCDNGASGDHVVRVNLPVNGDVTCTFRISSGRAKVHLPFMAR